MAKPKGEDIAGWGGGYYAKHVSIIAEKDVNQTKNRKAGLGTTESKGHIVRQLGLASTHRTGPKTYLLYTHSQVSNSGHTYGPAAFLGMNREDLEWFVAVALRELTTPAE